MISFDWSIRAGDVLTMVGALGVAGGILYRRGRDESALETAVKNCLEEISTLREEITALNNEMKQFATIIAKIAVQETKVELLMKWYDELRRGIGVIRE